MQDRDFYDPEKSDTSLSLITSSRHSPDAETELYYDNPYQLLVAVILSAQCTDKRVNMTTPLFLPVILMPEASRKATLKNCSR